MPRVLICEDDLELAEIMGELLEDEGALCLVTSSLDDVRAHEAEALACDVAILDVNLGVGLPSGVDVFRWLESKRYRGRVVFLTGHAATTPLLGGLRASGMPILAKPIPSEALTKLAFEEARR